MAICRRTARAEEDLIELWLHIAADNVPAADRLLDRLDAACNTLASHPLLGPARSDIAPGLRYFIVGAYLILYQRAGEDIEIVRFVHGTRNLPDLPLT